MNEKPVDRWLGLLAAAVGVLLYLLPKTQPVIMACCVAIWGFLIHPVIRFWWIEDKTWRQVLALLCLTIAVVFLGLWTKPEKSPKEPNPEQFANAEASRAAAHGSAGMVSLTRDQYDALTAAVSKETMPEPRRQSGSLLNSDLQYVFCGSDHLYFEYKNPSRHTAEKPRLGFTLMDLTNPYSYSVANGQGPTPQPFPIPTRVLSDDYVRPGDAAGFEDLLTNFSAHIKRGDVIWGVAWLTCINCAKQRAYYVYWKSGEGGWFAEAEMKNLQLPQPTVTPFSDAQISEYVDRIVLLKDRRSMKRIFTR
jgi:hypothetical protein